MSSTTLVAFIVTVPRPAAFVSVLGSWDNFAKPYPLKRDSRISKYAWRGCHSFSDIICDGDRTEDSSRSGGLKMGGTYWYYYQIDNDDEFCDPAKPSSRACPYLPGQEVNVLDVPWAQCEHRRTTSGSSASSAEYTLDPEKRFAPLDSPSPGLAGPLPPRALSSDAPELKQPQDLSRPCSRRDDSNGPALDVKVGSSEPARPYTRNGDGTMPVVTPDPQEAPPNHPKRLKRASSAQQLYVQPSWLSWVPARNMWSAGDAHDLAIPHAPAAKAPAKETLRAKASSIRSAPSTAQVSRSSSMAKSFRNERVLNAVIEEPLVEASCTSPSAALPRDQRPSHPQRSALVLDLGSKREDTFTSAFARLDLFGAQGWSPRADCAGSKAGHPADGQAWKTVKSESVSNSTRSSTFLSGISLDTGITMSNQSQPMTPSLSEWSISLNKVESPASEVDLSAQDWYNLPATEHASALTLQTLKALPDDSAATPTKNAHTLYSPASRRVEAWNASVDDSKSTLEELCEEMGYLGRLIQ